MNRLQLDGLQFESGSAHAAVPVVRVHTDVRAAAVVHLAFIHTCNQIKTKLPLSQFLRIRGTNR